MSEAFQFGALVGREKSAVTLMELLLSPAVGAAAGSALGGATAPKGHGLEGARRGAGRGAATTLGGTVGGMLGTAAGKALVNPVADMLIRNKHLGMAAGAMKALPRLGTALGAGLGGLAGYRGAGKMMGPASYDKKANVYDATEATSQIKPKPCDTNKSNIGHLTGQVSSNNPGQQGKSAADLSTDPHGASYVPFVGGALSGGLKPHPSRGPLSNVLGEGSAGLAGGVRGGLAGATIGGGLGAFGGLKGLGAGAAVGGLVGSALGTHRGAAHHRENLPLNARALEILQQQNQSPAAAAKAAAIKNANIGEYARYVPAGLAAGTGIGALGGLATSRKGKRLKGLLRGALIGGGTGLGVDVGAALGVLPGMGAGAGAGAGLGAAMGAGGGYLSGRRGNDLAESTGLGALGGLLAGVPVGGLAGIVGGGYLGGRTGNRLVRKALDKRDEDDAE